MSKVLRIILTCSFAFFAQTISTNAVEFIEIVEKQVVEQGNHNQARFRIEHFDQWVFRNQKTLVEAIKQLHERLQAESNSIQLTCQLSDEQKEKLILTGRGDIQAFTKQYAEIRKKFADNMDDQQAMQNIWREIQPLQKKYNGQIYGEGSLFFKVLDNLLDEQQYARMEALRREQRRFQYQATVMHLLSQLDQISPLTHEKREKLLALIQQRTRPPKNSATHQHNHHMTYFVLGQMAEIPEEELRPLFSDASWKVIRQKMKQGKSMKRNLEKHGLVPEEE